MVGDLREDLLEFMVSVRSFLEEQYRFQRELVESLREQSDQTRHLLHLISGLISRETFTPALSLYRGGEPGSREGGRGGRRILGGNRHQKTGSSDPRISRPQGPQVERRTPPDPIEMFERRDETSTSVLTRKIVDGAGNLLATARYDQRTLELIFAVPVVFQGEFVLETLFGQDFFLQLATENPDLQADYEPRGGGKIRKIVLLNLLHFSEWDYLDHSVQKILGT
ncbi:MAG: hypothetical protein ACTSU5_03000 [Promethearchaeota archaeon]